MKRLSNFKENIKVILGKERSLLKLVVGIGFLPNTRKSNPISKLLRPVFENSSLRNIVGSQLAVLTMFTGIASVPAGAFGVLPVDSHSFVQSIDVQVTTDSAITYPVPDAIGVSQGYHVFHPGIDIRSPLGSPIKPVAAGVVRIVANQAYGYGRRIEIDHGDGLTSLYAHLGKVFVEEGEYVNIDDVIAEVGLTGRTTGPHLHLEMYENGRTINPVTYLK